MRYIASLTSPRTRSAHRLILHLPDCEQVNAAEKEGKCVLLVNPKLKDVPSSGKIEGVGIMPLLC
jgi:hypothetical protein